MLSTIVSASTSFAPALAPLRTCRASSVSMVADSPKVFGSDDFCYGESTFPHPAVTSVYAQGVYNYPPSKAAYPWR
jgi:hypothetical protein